MRRSAKILISNWEKIIKKITHERHAYESVDDVSKFYVQSRKEIKKISCIYGLNAFEILVLSSVKYDICF